MARDPDDVRQLLDAERSRLGEVLRQVGDDLAGEEGLQDSELSSIDQHPAEAGTETHDLERDESIRESVEARLREVDDALGRLAAGTYGLCEVDGAPIAAERLEALPTARRCARHQAALEHT